MGFGRRHCGCYKYDKRRGRDFYKCPYCGYAYGYEFGNNYGNRYPYGYGYFDDYGYYY